MSNTTTNTSHLPTIEGLKIDITGKNIKPINIRKPQKIKTLKDNHVIVYPVSIKGGGEGKIVLEYNPKTPQYCPSTALDLGASVTGKILWGFSDKTIGRPAVGTKDARTGRHSNQETSLKGNLCLLAIVEGWPGETVEIHPSNRE